MSGRARLTLFALLATVLTAGALVPLVRPATWLLQAVLLLAVQSGVGAVARRVPLARSLTISAQVLVSLLILALLFAGEGRAGGDGLLSYLLTDFGALFQQGVQDVSEYAMPAPLTPGIRLLLVSGVLLIGLLVDMLAVTFRTAAAAGLPLLALYSVAAGLAGGDGASWAWFVAAGCGYLLLLLAEGRDRLTQWGRVFGAATRAPGGAAGPAGASAAGRPLAPVRTGRRIGAVALGLALAVPAALPSLGGGLLNETGAGGENGSGTGGGGTISAVNPLVSLQNSLNAQDNRMVLRYHTDNKQVTDQYLRILALDEFNGVKWEASGRSLSDVPRPLPKVPGLGDQVRLTATEVTTTISAANNYGQRYLPMPYPATQVEIPGRWRFEQAGRTLIGDQTGKDKFQTVQGAQYTVRSLQLRPTAQQLAAAPQPSPAILGEYTKLPENLPAVVSDRAREITKGAQDNYAKAVKLQDHFAVSGGFRYDTTVQSGTGSGAIERFLADKEGFCIHFSFSMAAMARTLGIPSRVAVGFTPGNRQPDGSMMVTMRDAHAWPELYFEGVGWTRFEPTPRIGTAPDYTLTEVPTAQPSAPAAMPSQSAQAPAPAASQSAECPPELKRLGECGGPAAQADAGAGGGGPSAGLVLGWVAAAVLLVGLPLLPLLWRGRLRTRRLASGDVLTVWRELGDAAWDVGIAPDGALSPRGAAERIVTLGQLETDAAEAVHRVAGAVERSLYAPPGAAIAYEGLAADVLLARAGLLAGVSGRARLRALLLPRSGARVGRALSARRAELTEALSARLATLRERLPRLPQLTARGRGRG
ncbi:transglutaminaseTgpA domain-containing protein [Streptomyces sp. NPDC090022]|uniref:transglutaminase family protein n=1 Tax=Streptomyces sp. NPDC090022 TaxID=3365920 RepID=UPI00382B7785